jgi:hypothetical protein
MVKTSILTDSSIHIHMYESQRITITISLYMKYLKSADSRYWIALVAVVLLLFFGFSDKQFSVLFTLSGTVQTFGFALIILKITKSRSVSGLSRETFICYTLIFSIRAILFRFYSVLFG